MLLCTLLLLLFKFFFFFLVCRDYLGMKNGDIPDGMIRASAHFSNRPAHYARLDGANKWSADGNNEAPWIQADLQYQTYVSGVLTQGDGDGNIDGDWITSFKVSTFLLDESEGGVETFVEDANGNHLVSPFALT